MEKEFNNPGIIQAMLDSIPAIVLAVDADVKILAYNRTAQALINLKEPVYLKRAGEILHCIHPKKEGKDCGKTSQCQDCLIRQSVNHCFAQKNQVRAVAELELETQKGVERFQGVIQVVPMMNDESKVMIMISHLRNVTQESRILNICAKCMKKVRSQKGKWINIEHYFKESLDVYLSHGYCDECYKEALAQLKKAGTTGLS
jgi:hypothetical protein